MNRRINLLVTMTVIISLCILGCGGGGDDNGGGNNGSPASDVSGTWIGTGYTPQTGTLPTKLILSQNGNSVSGTWDDIAVTGTVSGNQLILTLIPFTRSGVPMTGGGSATVTDNNMSGTLQMTGTSGSISVTINGTFIATRSSSRAASNADHAASKADQAASGLIAAIVSAIAN